jgi:hypothetical protein
VAGERLDYCTANRLPPGDDTASAAVPLPFPVRFFGAGYTSAYVNANGSISLTEPRAAFLPGQLTEVPFVDAADPDSAIAVAMIAPFLADVDTSAAGDRLVSYGSDDDSFCVQWADARQYGGEAHDTFQLLLRKAGADGDFDLVLNYDRLAWDTGNSTQGTPAAAVAGFGDGTGTLGRYVRFAGSGTAKSLLDGGAHALVEGNQNASVPGRYVIPFRSTDVGGFGTLTGSLAAADGSPAAGVVVDACRAVDSTTTCDTTTSRADGSFAFVALRAAGYELGVPEGQELEHDPGTVSVTAGSGAVVGILRLRPKPDPSPSPSRSPSASATPSSSPSPSRSPTPSRSPSPPLRPPVVLPPEPGPAASSSPSARPSSSPSPTPSPKALSPATPRISGTSRVGRTLTAKPGTWRPPGVTLSYQWLRTGRPITGATKSKYKLKNADRGRRLQVVVTGRKSGYTTIFRTSGATGKVKRR